MMKKNAKKAFTLVEMLIVVVIIAIAAMIAIPQIGSASVFKLNAAVNVIASDLEYAKSLAISRQSCYSVIFDTASESYRIVDENGNDIENEFKGGDSYVVDFKKDSRLQNVDISAVNIDGTNSISFDYLASPYSGTDLTSSLIDNAVITLSTGNNSAGVEIEPVTGYIKHDY